VLEKKKPAHNSDAVPDVPADNPKGTMDRFTHGLRRVLAVGKPTTPPPKLRTHKRKSA